MVQFKKVKDVEGFHFETIEEMVEAPVVKEVKKEEPIKKEVKKKNKSFNKKVK